MLKYKAIPTSNKTKLAIFKILTVMVIVPLDIRKNGNIQAQLPLKIRRKRYENRRYCDTKDKGFRIERSTFNVQRLQSTGFAKLVIVQHHSKALKDKD